MKGFYIAYSFILAFTVVVFTQRAIDWACKWLEGKRRVKNIRPSNERYAVIYALFKHAKIHTVCWMLIDLTALYAYFDCVVQVFKG